MPDRKEHAKKMAKNFNRIMALYASGEIAPKEAVIKGLNILKIYLESTHTMYGEPLFDISGLFSALDETGMGSQKDTLKEKFLEGCLIEGLVQFGSSKNQAYESICKWRGISPSSAKSSHKLFLKEFPPKIFEGGKEAFSKECYAWIIEATEDRTPFPSTFLKASPAFDRLLEACSSAKEEHEKEEWPIYNAHSYE